ncbi:MAG TPA: ribbon-helix-helix protein, CopG family [Myxococcaceae bacterium]
MKSITVKLREATLRRLQEEARAAGRPVASLIRERVETPVAAFQGSVYAKTSNLAGSVAGSRRSATNDRRRFRRR